MLGIAAWSQLYSSHPFFVIQIGDVRVRFRLCFETFEDSSDFLGFVVNHSRRRRRAGCNSRREDDFRYNRLCHHWFRHNGWWWWWWRRRRGSRRRRFNRRGRSNDPFRLERGLRYRRLRNCIATATFNSVASPHLPRVLYQDSRSTVMATTTGVDNPCILATTAETNAGLLYLPTRQASRDTSQFGTSQTQTLRQPQIAARYQPSANN